MAQADRLVGGPEAVLLVEDTALPKKGTASVGVAPQYATALGKNATCQTLVSLTLALGEGPVPIAAALSSRELDAEGRSPRQGQWATGAADLPEQARDRA